MINLFRPIEEWIGRREDIKLKERMKLVERLGESIGKEVYKFSDEGRVLEEDANSGCPTNIIRYTVKINDGLIFGKRELKILLRKEKFNPMFHQLDKIYLPTLMYGIGNAFMAKNKYNILHPYYICKFGIISNDDDFEFYIELYREEEIQKAIFNKCITSFNNSKFMIDKFDWSGVESGASITIPVNIREYKIGNITDCDIEEICRSVTKKLNETINGENQDISENEFIVIAETTDYFANNINIIITKQ